MGEAEISDPDHWVPSATPTHGSLRQSCHGSLVAGQVSVGGVSGKIERGDVTLSLPTVSY